MDKEKKREYGRRFYQRHKERLREIGNAYYWANRERIRKKAKEDYHGEKREAMREYGRRYCAEHREQERLKYRKYYWAHRENCLLASKQRRDREKAKVFELLGGKCRRCGNTDVRVLQVNHINGGGTIDKQLIGRSLYKKIASGERATNEFSLLCANCNVLYEYERGYRK